MTDLDTTDRDLRSTDRVDITNADPRYGSSSKDSTEDNITRARQLLADLGMLTGEETMRDTPARFVNALLELTDGALCDPTRHFARTFDACTTYTRMIAVPNISFVSICEHHLLPFTGIATVAYIPAAGAQVIGLSKLARLTREYARRPQIQERIGEQIVDSITSNLKTDGVACVLRSVHSCMALRGVHAEGAEMVTSHFSGTFQDDSSARAEFLALVSGSSAPIA